MKTTFIYLLFLPVFCFFASCNGSVESKEEEKQEISENVESTDLNEEIEAVEQLPFDKEAFVALFPKREDTLISIEVVNTKDPVCQEIAREQIDALYPGTEDYFVRYYAMAAFPINEVFTGYIVGTENNEGLYTHLWVFHQDESEPSVDYIYVAASAGDAGEVMKEKGWLLDLNEDGIPELLQRGGSTYLDPAATSDEERETNIEDVEVWEFDTKLGAFVKTESVDDQESLNQRFRMELEDLF